MSNNDRNESQAMLPDVVKEIIINAPVEKVWKAVSSSEGIAAWFMPNNFEPVVGFQFHVDAGPFGKSPCQVLEITPLIDYHLSGTRIGSLHSSLKRWKKELGSHLHMADGYQKV